MNFIPYGRQNIVQDDINAVIDALQSDFLTTGPKIEEFERAISEYCGAKYAVAVSSGTAALHIASLALLNHGDKVLTTPNSFLATANTIVYAGATPIFVDITPDGNIDLDMCEQYLKNDPNIKAIYGVHFSGNSLNQMKLQVLRKQYGVVVLEDCAHSIGAVNNGVSAGSCINSECSIFSFHPVKHLTTGEGGAVTTNSQAIYQKLILLRNHGMTRDEVTFKNRALAYDRKGNQNPWYYEMQELGYNYRITDFQCALGISQMRRLPLFLEQRRNIAKTYDNAFKNSKIILPLYTFSENSAYHLYVVNIEFSKLRITKAELFMKMRDKMIGLQLHYIPINKQPFYVERGYGKENTPVMDSYYQSALSLPIYYSLSHKEQHYIIDTLVDIVNEHS